MSGGEKGFLKRIGYRSAYSGAAAMDAPDQFIKLPKALFSIHPYDALLYANYVDLKAYGRKGGATGTDGALVLRPGKDRHNLKYWAGRLVSRGWAEKMPDGAYRLRSYQHVWRSLGVQRSWTAGIKKYKFAYHKISIGALHLCTDRKVYARQIKDLILRQVAANKKAQVKCRLKESTAPGQPVKTETSISCRTVGTKLFGLRSSASGSKYRKLYFDVIDEPTELRKLPGNLYRYPCKRIAL